MKKFALFTAFLLCLALCPTSVWAAAVIQAGMPGRALSPGAPGKITVGRLPYPDPEHDYTETWNDDTTTVHFGGWPWKVIGYKQKGSGYVGVIAGTGGSLPTVRSYMTLLRIGGSNAVSFSEDDSNVFAGSELERWMNEIEYYYSTYQTLKEQDIVLARDLWVDGYDGVAGYPATGAKYWPLSIREASHVPYSIRINHNTQNGWWWLRTGMPSYEGQVFAHAAYVKNGTVIGSDYGEPVQYRYGSRPAFNLNISDVLFTSAASEPPPGGWNLNPKGGKDVPLGVLSAVTAPSAGPVKFTVLENSLDLTSVTNISVNDKTVTFDYTGAASEHDQFLWKRIVTLSAIVVDGAGALKYYGQLAENMPTNGSGSVTLPEDFAATDKLQVFVEEITIDRQHKYGYTDFAGTPVTIYGDGTAPTEAPALPDSTPNFIESAPAGPITMDEAAGGYLEYFDEGDLEPEGGGLVASEAAIQAAAADAGVSVALEGVHKLPVFSAGVTAGKVAAVGFPLTGAQLMAGNARDVVVLKILPGRKGGLFTYESEPEKFGDKKFTLLTRSGAVHTGAIQRGETYTLTVFILDGGDFDVDGEENGEVVDPVALLGNAESTATLKVRFQGRAAGSEANIENLKVKWIKDGEVTDIGPVTTGKDGTAEITLP